MTQFARQQLGARRVTVETCRTLLQQPNLTHEQASKLIEHLYLFANVVADVFIEQHCHTTKMLDRVEEVKANTPRHSDVLMNNAEHGNKAK